MRKVLSDNRYWATSGTVLALKLAYEPIGFQMWPVPISDRKYFRTVPHLISQTRVQNRDCVTAPHPWSLVWRVAHQPGILEVCNQAKSKQVLPGESRLQGSCNARAGVLKGLPNAPDPPSFPLETTSVLITAPLHR